MSDITQQLIDNLARVRERMQQACAAAGRPAEDVQLVAVTKYVDAATTAALLAAGCQTLGESRPQQLWEKAANTALASAEWHMVGHLQRNKVPRTVAIAQLIHSVDSPRLLKAINDAAAQQARAARVLLEVNCSGEAAKHGFSAGDLKQLLPELESYPRVQVTGLMTMAARAGGAATAARNFASLRELRDQVAPECPPSVKLTELSMGMSQDFEVAIEEGATIVRIGSLLFEGLL